MLDIDDFKKVNDTYGHHEGDVVIRRISDIMREQCAAVSDDISIGRWGGEEFMILVPSADKDTVKNLAESLREAFKKEVFEVSGNHTVSVGVTTALPGEHVDVFCMRADDALYEAKGSGKDRVVIK